MTNATRRMPAYPFSFTPFASGVLLSLEMRGAMFWFSTVAGPQEVECLWTILGAFELGQRDFGPGLAKERSLNANACAAMAAIMDLCEEAPDQATALLDVFTLIEGRQS